MEKHLRDLLLDCRTALRRAIKDFEDMPLRERLDDALIDQIIPPLSQAQQQAKHTPQTLSAQQVAYGWQVAARELQQTHHPQLHQEMGERVRELLDAERLQDPGVEIVGLRAKLEATSLAQQAVVRELDTLRRFAGQLDPARCRHFPRQRGGTRAAQAGDVA